MRQHKLTWIHIINSWLLFDFFVINLTITAIFGRPFDFAFFTLTILKKAALFFFWLFFFSFYFFFTVELASVQGRPHSKFNWVRSLKPFPRCESANFRKNFSSFSSYNFAHFTKITITRAPNWLIFGTRIEGWKANTTTNFGVNLIYIQGVINDFTHKARSIFCHVYKVKRFEEQAEN